MSLVPSRRKRNKIKPDYLDPRISELNPIPLFRLKYKSYQQIIPNNRRFTRSTHSFLPKTKVAILYRLFHVNILRSLALDSSADSDINLEFFDSFKSLQSFKIKGTIHDEMIFNLFRFLTGCTKLDSLVMDFNIYWKVDVLSSFFSAVTSLRELRGLKFNSHDAFINDLDETGTLNLKSFIGQVLKLDRLEFLILDSYDFHLEKTKDSLCYKSKLDIKDFSTLKLLLTSFPNLLKIEIDLSRNEITFGNPYKKLWNYVNKNQGLRVLSINFSEIHDGTNTLLSEFSGIKKLAHLEDLYLNFTNGSHLDVDIAVKEIIEFSIKKLIIILNGVYIRNNYTNFTKLLEKTKCITHFEMIAEENEFINDEDLLGLGNGLNLNQSLKSLILNFKLSTNVTGKAGIAIIQALIEKKRLENVQLNIGDCAISWKENFSNPTFEIFYATKDERDLEIFIEVCSKFRFFEKVVIIYSMYATLDPLMLKKLMQTIQTLPKLTHFHIQFTLSTNHIPKAITYISKTLLHLKNLRVLHFFGDYDCYHLTDSAFDKLSASLPSLLFLEDLNIRFTEYHEITQKGLITLVKSIKKLELLNTLVLDFENIRDMGDEIFTEFGRTLKVLGQLKVLDLSLTCDEETAVEINCQSILTLMSGIRSLWQLESLTFIVPQEVKLDRSILDEFEVSLRYCSGLKILNLTLLNSENITNAVVDSLKKSLRLALPLLEEIYIDYEEPQIIKKALSEYYSEGIEIFETGHGKSLEPSF